jgi:hypothetical protein
MIAIGRDFVAVRANWPDAVDTRQSPRTPLPHSLTDFFKFRSHACPALAAKALRILILYVRQHLHIATRPLAHRSIDPRIGSNIGEFSMKILPSSGHFSATINTNVF